MKHWTILLSVECVGWEQRYKSDSCLLLYQTAWVKAVLCCTNWHKSKLAEPDITVRIVIHKWGCPEVKVSHGHCSKGPGWHQSRPNYSLWLTLWLNAHLTRSIPFWRTLRTKMDTGMSLSHVSSSLANESPMRLRRQGISLNDLSRKQTNRLWLINLFISSFIKENKCSWQQKKAQH